MPKFNTRKGTNNDSSIADGRVEIQNPQTAGQIDYKMRDLYNRANKLPYWLNRINTDLDGSDKLCFNESM
jgi:hypothetical protein